MSLKVSQKSKELVRVSLTICNLMIGAQLLALPYIYMRLAWPIGILFTTFTALYSLFGFNYIVDACYYTSCQTISDLLTGLFGKVFSNIVEVFIVIQYLGYLTQYVSICADYINIFVLAVSNYNFKTVYIKIIIFVVLSGFLVFKSLKAISNLSTAKQSFAAFAVICACIFLIIATKVGTTDININGVVSIIKLPSKRQLAVPIHVKGHYIFFEIMQRLPIFKAIYGCQASIPIVYNNMPGDGEYRRALLKKYIVIGTLATSGLCVVMAFVCLFLFGSDISTNVLLSFVPQNYTMTTVRLLYAMVILLTYVVVTFPIRGMFMKIFKQNKDTKKDIQFIFSYGSVLYLFPVDLVYQYLIF
ncbi:Solute carrier family protein [Spironucleus salmonicida]|uniref:Solute carrier family protein n=1 Tax=Spironucleus salmonicida TaxID=348837 RepID=V6LZU1_9EUKA|nr:Solute carrier family protein [Spironucleus salmonicida]|eukprot:EST49271.1 Transmembrane amino acid transporter protein [Spironucleus salmonicida]